MILYIIIAVVLIAGDQLAKLCVAAKIGAQETVSVIPYILDFVYVKNTGAAFSIFSDMTWLLGALSLIFCIAVAVYIIWKKPTNRLLCAALTLMFAGAFGNAIDRIFRGYVIDFIRTVFVAFPVFNIADIAITVGAALLILYVILSDRQKKKD